MANHLGGAIFDVDGCWSTRRTNGPGAMRSKSSWRRNGATSSRVLEVHPAGLSASHVRQAALHGAQATLEYFDVPDAATRSRAYGDRKQSMVIELCERLRLAQLQLRGGADLAGRHREPSLGRGARWPAPRRPTAWRAMGDMYATAKGGGMCGWAACLATAWSSRRHGSSSATSRWRGGGDQADRWGTAQQTERGLLGPDELPLLRHLYEVVVLERPVDIPWESFLGAASYAPRAAESRPV